MKNSYRIILYIFLLILLTGGIALFLFQGQVLGFFEARTDSLIPLRPAVTPSRNILDLSALESPNFKALVNNVINFNFDNICWRPDTETSQGAATSSNGESAVVAPLSCVQGNNSPFPVRVK